MAPILGKRKRQQAFIKPRVASSSESDHDEAANMQEILRRHFEAKFAPLDSIPVPRKEEQRIEEQDRSGVDGDSDWNGIENEEKQASGVQVIEHANTEIPTKLSGADARAFMNTKPPPNLNLTTKRAPTTSTSTKASPEDVTAEKLNLANDLALQRLLSESHLLHSSSSPTATQNLRQKQLDLRLRTLGSKASFLAQEKMPMAHRKGIIAKAKDKEKARRLEAKENGIVLEKAKGGDGKGTGKMERKKREGGVSGPSVGRFKGGTLKLSERDVRTIKGPVRKGGNRR